MPEFAIAEVAVGAGRIGLCPMPGRGGDYAGDLGAVLAWAPGLVLVLVLVLVLTMTTSEELARKGAGALPRDLAAAGIAWRHLAVADFGASSAALSSGWAGVGAEAAVLLAAGGRVLAHCMGGCGRSGMAVMRLMVEAGEAPEAALARLRAVRQCAVETEEQQAWAAAGQGP